MINRQPCKPKHPGGLLPRLLFSLLAALLLCAVLPSAQPVQALDWMTPYLENAIQYGILREDLIDNPQPEETITRGEFISMVNRAYGYTDTGPTPFTDVFLEDWYYEDIGTAYHMGYFKGTSPSTASPKDYLTREQAAVLLARNMMLEERSGEVLGYTDSRHFASWSRGIIEAVTQAGVITGFPDGSYRPQDNVTRIQVAVMLMRAVGTPLTEPGVYADRNYSGNVTITSPNVKLKDAVIDGNLYISGGVDLGGIELENVTVLGRIIVSGGGESELGARSVVLRNVLADELTVDSISNQFVTLRAEGLTEIPRVLAHTHAYIEDVTEDNLGLRLIHLKGEPGTNFQLAGNIKEAVNFTPGSLLNIAQGTAQNVTIDEDAVNSTLNIDGSAEVDILNLDVATNVTGTGDVSHLEVNAPGSSVEMLPDDIVIRPGITANIAGEEMDSQDALESSEDPRLLAGYPTATNIAPTSAEAVFSTNKRGTIYWAISTITAGSISEEHLIKPPAYGGNILKSGTITASASNVPYTAKITGLTKAGSYYITAILVDNRGYRSPVKVAAFTTPDDTVPAFINPNTYTLLADVGDEQVAQAMVMANKTCKLYYVLLPKGSVAPTAHDFQTQSLAGSLGHGILDIYKNEQTLLSRINSIPLEEETTYDLYLWLSDADGAKSSAVKKLTLTTKDRTPPVLQQLIVTKIAARSVELSFVVDEPATFYWAVVKQGAAFYTAENEKLVAADPNALLAKLQIETGLNSLVKGNKRDTKGMTATTFTVSGLDPQTAYDLYYIVKDEAGNYALYSRTIAHPFPIHTLDDQPPTVEQEFTHDGTTDPSHPTPYPDTTVNLVFSEHVKGTLDRDNDTVPDNDVFLTLYQQYKGTAAGREILAGIFRRYFKLYDASTSLPVPERTAANESDPNLEWVIDYRYITVSTDPSGTGELIVSFPHNPDNLAASAINLAGGVTYYFTLESIADTSTSENPIESIRGVATLPQFTTISAQIALREATIGGDEYIDLDGDGVGDVLVHMTFAAVPLAHDSMSETIRWDMVFWSESTVSFELYERLPADSTWKQVGKDSMTITTYQDETRGMSVNYALNENVQGDILRNMEDDGREYAIRVTAINGNKDMESWNTKVVLNVTTLAGPSGQLSEAARNIAQSATLTDVLNENVTDITTPPNFMRTYTFIDHTPPQFIDPYPALTPYDEGVTLEVALNRSNSTFYYMVAPRGIQTTVWNDTAINSTATWETLYKDGKHMFETFPDANKDGIKEYMPILATTPVSDAIVNPPANRLIRSGRGRFDGLTNIIDVEGLTPDTEYIAYFVLQGESQDSRSEVYVFSFKTEKSTRPIITLVNNNSSVLTTVDRNSTLNYFLAVQGEEGSKFNEPFAGYANTGLPGWNAAWAGKDYTVLQAMNDTIKDEDGNSTGSVFDHYATDEAKYTFGNLIRSQTAGTSNIVLVSDGHFDKGIPQEITSDQMEEGVYHTLIVVGRSDQGSGDAFAAIWPVFRRDNEAPYVVGTVKLESGAHVLEGYGDVGTSGGIRVFSGELTITFNEPLYNMVTKGGVQVAQPLDGCLLNDPSHPANGDYGRLSALYSLQPSTTTIEQQAGAHEAPIHSVTFKFNRAKVGARITFVNTICDANRNRHTEELVVRLSQIVLDDEGKPTGQVLFSVTPAWISPKV